MTPESPDELLRAFDRALATQSLHMAYQPKVALSTGRFTGVEALVRWTDPDRGAVKPSLFIPMAEEHGRIDDLTLWGLRTILRQWRTWHDGGLDCSFSFNISALSLQNLDFPDLVEWMCRALDVPPDRIILELTEGSTQPLIKLMDTLTRFRIKGIALALDDFGTGYSSLFQLKHLPFNRLKVDRAFVSDLAASSDARVIVDSMIRLAHDLGMEATAEGVETEDQLRILRDLGCDWAQGFLFAAPMPADELAGWVHDSASRLRRLIGNPASRDRRVKANALS